MKLLLLSALIAVAGANVDNSQLEKESDVDDTYKVVSYNDNDEDVDATNATNGTNVTVVVKVSPTVKVVQMIAGLKKTVEEDAAKETTQYDLFACWCEDTLAEKAAEIATGKTNVKTLTTAITVLGAEMAAIGADIKQLEKDIAEATKSAKESKAIRSKEKKAYMKVRTEAEKSIGSLEGAINNLAAMFAPKSSAAAGLLQESSGFLASDSEVAAASEERSFRQAQVLSSLIPIRVVLSQPALVELASESDLDKLRRFTRQDPMSAVQVDSENNPASGVIQGILKGMYDGMTMQQEKDNGEEANTQKAYEGLRATQMMEIATLTSTKTVSVTDQSSKASFKSQKKNDLATAKKSLAADEKFYASTKKSCMAKADAWNDRTRLRVEELQGFAAAIEILNSTGAQSTFGSAANSFLQVSQTSTRARIPMFLQVSSDTPTGSVNLKAAAQLFELAAKYGGSLSLTQVASEVTMGGHFDKIIYTMDKMVKQLTVESKKDAAKKIRCESKTAVNTQQVEDIVFKVNKTTEKIARMVIYIADWETTIANIKKKAVAIRATMAKMTQQVLEAHAQFVKAENDDLASIALLDKSAAALNKVFAQNVIKKTKPRTSTNQAMLFENDDDVKPKPRPPSSDGDSRKSASGGIVAIIEMIASDLKGEVKDGRLQDASASKAYEEDYAAAESSLNEQKQAKAAAVKAKADVTTKLGYLKDVHLAQMLTDKENLLKTQAATNVECAFLTTMVMTGGETKTQFQTNIDNRLVEAKGLSEAKTFLAGATVLPR